MPTAVRSHAKINLGLHIGAPRADGYHGLATVYQTLALYDVVTVRARRAAATALRLTSNDNRVPTDARNTAWKMTALALGELGIAAEVEIHIEKRLPVQGGLGAGSANAVAALVGLEVELEIDGTEWAARRLEIAAEVGSDVPLFLVGGTVLGRDRGQIVEPLEDIEPMWCVVAAPAVGVSTPQAFRDWDALCAREGLTAEASTVKLNELSRVYAGAFQRAIPEKISGAISRANPGAVGVVGEFSTAEAAETAGGVREGVQSGGSSGVSAAGGNLAGPLKSALVRTGSYSWTENDFERVVFPQHPSLSAIKHILAAAGTPEGAVLAMLSGSGSALFGLYQTREDAEAARERLRPMGVRSYLTETLGRAAYWREMILQQQD
jgi:4-diphosphocytidyl-2-C-methyl-D-erythritol kinase